MSFSRKILLGATLVATCALALPASASNFVFINGDAPIGWDSGTTANGAPKPHPAPFVKVDGVSYRLGDAGVQFHRYQAGGVQVVLGDCKPADAAKMVHLELYSDGAFSEMLQCAADDSGK